MLKNLQKLHPIQHRADRKHANLRETKKNYFSKGIGRKDNAWNKIRSSFNGSLILFIIN